VPASCTVFKVLMWLQLTECLKPGYRQRWLSMYKTVFVQ